MTTASVSVLKAKLSMYLARVKRGEEVRVTDRGRQVARLVPVMRDTGGDRIARLVRMGVLRPGRPGGLRPGLLKPPRFKDPGGAVLKALLEEREEDRGR
jgi:prevent-host-death family protein